MPALIALLVYFCAIAWLLKHAPREHWSNELWIPFTWVLITVTHPVGLWIALLTGTARGPEGSNLDTAIFLTLMATAFRVAGRNGARWREIIAQNKWLFLYFTYTGISVLWAGSPISSLKLWVKDAGNLFIVLAVLAQPRPDASVKALLLRVAYVFVPLSILLFKYFPDLGRQYDIWTWQPMTLGASDSKNSLGAAIILCSVGLFSEALDRSGGLRVSGKARSLANLAVIIATIWLLVKSSCATALACTVVVFIFLFLLRNERFREHVQNLGTYIFFIVPLCIFILQYVLGFADIVVEALGRNMTFTGRTPIWAACVAAEINPLFGSGYASFWKSVHAQEISSSLKFYFTLQEAHSGYVETYLSGGLVGLGLLITAIVTSTRRIMRRLRNTMRSRLSLVVVIIALVYNFTESAFSGLNPIWLLLLFGMVEWPDARGSQRLRIPHLAAPAPKTEFAPILAS